MLERQAGCLEQGSLRRLLPTSRNPLKSRRMLHSAFWDHGACNFGGMDMSPLWQALVRETEPTKKQESKHVSGSSASCGILLDFLYPTGALYLLRAYTQVGLEATKVKQSKTQITTSGQRLYSSKALRKLRSTIVEEPEDEPEDESQELLVQDIDAEVYAAESEDYEAQSDDNDMHEYEEHFEHISLDDILDNKANLRTNLAWALYERSSQEEKDAVTPRLLDYVAQGTTSSDAARILELHRHLREPASVEALRGIVNAALLLGDMPRAIEAQLELMQDRGIGAGVDAVFAGAVAATDWQNALRLWKAASNLHNERSDLDIDIWRGIETVPNLQGLAMQLADYVDHHLGDATNGAGNISVVSEMSTDLPPLASRIVYRALAPEGHFIRPEVVNVLLDKLQKWDVDTGARYEQLIERYVKADRTQLVADIYQRYRRRRTGTMSQHILDLVLSAACSIRNLKTMQKVLFDWASMYGKIPQTMFRRCLAAMANWGDLPEFTKMWNRYMASKPKLNAHDIVPLMHVHVVRGEASEAIDIFETMESTYGLKPVIRNYNTLINAYGKIGDIDGAFESFNTLLEAGIKPDDYTFGTLMSICTKRGDSTQAMELYQMAESLGVQRSTAMIDAIVLGHTQEDRLTQAEKICEDAAVMNPKGRNTTMWNHLLTAYAMKRDLDNANRVLRRMKILRIEFDGNTYAAVMQSLSMAGQPERAYKVLKKVLPEANVEITSFHYAVVMGGFIATREAERTMQVYRDMLGRGIPDCSSTKLLYLKAIALRDRRNKKFAIDAQTQELRLSEVEDFLQNALATSDRSDFAHSRTKGFDRQPIDIVSTTAYFEHVIFVYGQEEAFERVKQLYDTMKERLPDKARDEPPRRILSALMIANLKEKNHDGIKQCWDLAFEQAKRQGKPISEDTTTKLLPIHRFDLALPLTYLILSLSEQRKVEELENIIKETQEAGFELDSKNWNAYIQSLVKGFRYGTAFELTETHLMLNWTGWSHMRWKAPVHNRLSMEQRNKKKDRRYLRPTYHTLLYLAKAFMTLEDVSRGPSQDALTARRVYNDLVRKCPMLIGALRTLEPSGDALEAEILGDQVLKEWTSSPVYGSK